MKKSIKGFILAAGIVGAAYVIYKSYITYKKELDEGLTSDEIEERQFHNKTKKDVEDFNKKMEAHISPSDEFEDDEGVIIPTVVETSHTAQIISNNGIDIDIEPEPNAPDDIDEDYFDEDEIEGFLYTGGEVKLKHDPNSKAAMDQYRMMILSDYEVKPNLYDTLQIIWDFGFTPHNERDDTVYMHIEEERERFFGPDSIYTNEANMAELFIFFANKLAFDYDVSVLDCMKLILDSVDLDDSCGVTKFSETLLNVEKHNYVSRWGRYGIFGLTMDDYREKLCKYPQVIVTRNEEIGFDMEYNVFCNEYGAEFVEGLEDNE